MRKSPVGSTWPSEGEDKGVTKELLVRRFTLVELKKRREHGLCYHCDERYTFNHSYKRLFWIEIEEENSSGMEDEKAEGDEGGEKPEVFLNTMVGMATPQTMRFMAKIGKIPLTVLIDTRSTHNFLHEPLAKLVGLQTESNSSLRAVVANGERIGSPGMCREVTLNLQNSQFLVDFYLIELEGCDAVLGAQWLRTLGPILWNFGSMEMGFKVGDKKV